MNHGLLGVSFTVLAAMLAAAPVAAQPPLSADQSIQGRIEASDPRAPAVEDSGEEASRYDDHRFRFGAGQRVRVSLDSEDFDPVVHVYRAGDLTTPIAMNDDYGDGFNSRVTFAAPVTGEYVVRVLSFEADGTGAYSLRAEPLPPLPAPITAHSGTANTIWRVFQGSLDASDPEIEDARFDDYQITLRQGEQVIVRLESEEFDPVVHILAASDREGYPLDSDDDGGPGLNSLLGFEAEEAGDYIVRVTAFGSDGSGAYTLRIGD